jgi:hypothetical protein
MPSSVVGRCTTGTPRSQVAATKPARSVVAPPPIATSASVRVNPIWPRTSQQYAATCRSFCALAVGHLDGVRLEAGGVEVLAHGVGGRPQRRGVHDRDALGPASMVSSSPSSPSPTTTS